MATGYRRDQRMSRRNTLGGNAFSPQTLAGLAAWYRADLGISIGTGVSAWADQSGSGDVNRNATQATGANQPAFNASDAVFGGKPSLSFPLAAPAVSLTTGTWSAGITAFTAFAVASTTQTGTNYFVFDTKTGTRIFIFKEGASTMHSQFGDAAGSTIDSTKTFSGAQVFVVVHNGASSQIYPSQQTAGITGATGSSTLSDLVIGNFQGLSLPLGGAIAELAFFSRVLTAPEIASLLTYGGNRYGIVIGP